MNGVMFAVNWKQRLALTASFSSDELSGSYEAFLVCKADGLASFDRLVSCFEARHANNSTNHEIHFRMRGYSHRSRCAMNDLDSSRLSHLVGYAASRAAITMRSR